MLLNVLEHIPDDHRALGDIYESLAPGGKIVLWVPAFEALYGKFDERIGHYRRYRRNQLLALVHNAGFQQVSARYTNMPGFFAWWLVVRVLGPLAHHRSPGVDLRPLLHPGHPPGRALRATSRSVNRCWLSPSGRRWRSPPRRHRNGQTAGEQRRPHLAALDGLRGLAVIAVLLFHAGKLQGGFLGVDLFFALSGFLITSLLLAEVDLAGRVDSARLLGSPACAGCSPPCSSCSVVVTVSRPSWRPSPSALRRSATGRGRQAYVANWHAIAGHRDYWASFELPSPLFGHLWSLAIEEQFYLVWPVVVGADRLAEPPSAPHRRRRLHRRPRALSLVQMIRLFDPSDPTACTSAPTRGPAACCLVRCSRQHRCDRPRPGSPSRLPGVYDVAVVGDVDHRRFVLGPGQRPELGVGVPRWALRPLAPVGDDRRRLCGAARMQRSTRWIGWAPLRVTGVLSYSLYLWHWPMYALLSEQRTGCRVGRCSGCASPSRSPPQQSPSDSSRTRSAFGPRGHAAAPASLP